jgi:hypothetical protein
MGDIIKDARNAAVTGDRQRSITFATVQAVMAAREDRSVAHLIQSNAAAFAMSVFATWNWVA